MKETVPTDTLSSTHETSQLETPCCIVQLCDGTEVDGYPGISVIKRLLSQPFTIRGQTYAPPSSPLSLPFTGAQDAFYSLFVSKVVMKRLFMKHDAVRYALARHSIDYHASNKS